MQDIRKVRFDINRDIYVKIDAKQNDINSRFIEFTLINNSLIVDLTNHTVQVYGIKPDGSKIFNNATIEDPTNGKVLVELTNQTLAVPGILCCELVISGADGSILSTKTFDIDVIASIRDDKAVESTNEFNVFSKAMAVVTNLNNKADITYVDKKVSSVAIGGPDKAFASLQDLNNAYPSGDVRNKVLTSNGHIYYWNGSSWIDTGIQYQSTGIANNSISGIMLEGATRTKNLFNYKTATMDSYIVYATGAVASGNTTYVASDYIPVQPSTAYTRSDGLAHYAFYDANKNFISSATVTDLTITTPSNAAFIRLTFLKATYMTAQFEVGTTKTDFVPFGYIVDCFANSTIFKFQDNTFSGTELKPSAVTPDKTSFLTLPKNLFNKATVTQGYYVNSGNGVLLANSAYFASDYIPVQPNTTYTRLICRQMAFFDANKNYISGINSTGQTPFTFTTPNGAYYIRISLSGQTEVDNEQVELGTNQTTYTPFISYNYMLSTDNIPVNQLGNLISNYITLKNGSVGLDTVNFLTRGQNLFNYKTATDGYYINSGNGALLANTAYAASDFIPVQGSTNYTASHNRQLSFFDSNKKYISGISESTVVAPKNFTTPSNAAYIKISILKATTAVNNFMVVQGDTLPSSYQSYGYSFDTSKIIIKQSDLVQDPTSLTAGLDINLPRNLYALKGDNSLKEQFNLFFKNMLVTNSNYGPKNVNFFVTSSYGRQYEDCWRMESGIGGYITPSAPFSLSIKAQDTALNTLISKTTNVELVDKQSNTNAVRLLGLGDSITRDGTFLAQVQTKLINAITVGTRQYDGDIQAREGRGGWTLAGYMNNIGITTTVDSPFLFPTGLADGSKYKGNTDNWKKICYTLPNDYEYQGFQKIAKGWTGTDFLYDTNGYYKNPSVGDIMVDPSKPVGSKWVQWDGTQWSAMATQPTTFEFSFAKYMQRFAAAFPNGAPTHVCVMLGANDFQKTIGVVGIDNFIANLNTVISSIHAYNSNIKVIINLPTLGAHQDAWGINVGCTGTSENYNNNIKLETQRLLKEYDNDTALSNNIYIAPIGLCLDTVYGFDYVLENANVYSTEQVKRYNNWVHPSDAVGHRQMGDALAAVIQKIR